MPTQIPQATGTAIGSMTASGGLAAAFDGVTSQAAAASAVSSGTSGYVGKTYASGHVISKAIVYGSADQGFIFTANPSVTIQLRGKNGVPSSATDGTLIGTLTFTDTANESAGRTITSTDTINSYTNVWVYVNDGAADSHVVSELQIFEVSSTAQSVAIACATSLAISAHKIAHAIIAIVCSSSVLVAIAHSFAKTVAVACSSSISVVKVVGKKVAISAASTVLAARAIAKTISISCSSTVGILTGYIARVVIKKIRSFVSAYFGKGTITSR